MRERLAARPLAVALPLLVAACVWSIGGLRDDRPWGNGTAYYDSLNVVRGQLPYRDFFLEYPPFALPVFLAPQAPGPASLHAYNQLFKGLMVLLAVVLLVVLDRLLLRVGAPRLWPLLAFAVAPAAIGQYFLNRYDVWPTLITAVLVGALLARRPAWVGVLLALGFAAKTYPVVLVPTAVVVLGRDRLRRATVAAAITLVAVYGFFLVAAPKGLALSYKVQLTRHLETESLGASILLAADRLGLYHAHVIAGNPGSIDLAGALPTAVGVLTWLVVVGAIAWIAVRGEGVLLPVAAALTAFVVFSKVLSPQYLIWLAPFVPLVSAAGTALLLAAMVLSQLVGYGYDGLHIADWTVAVLCVRNLLLVALFSVLVRALRRPGRARLP